MRGLEVVCQARSYFCKHTQATFMPYKGVLKDERPTSNVE
jgi:hypothetical protein